METHAIDISCHRLTPLGFSENVIESDKRIDIMFEESDRKITIVLPEVTYSTVRLKMSKLSDFFDVNEKTREITIWRCRDVQKGVYEVNGLKIGKVDVNITFYDLNDDYTEDQVIISVKRPFPYFKMDCPNPPQFTSMLAPWNLVISDPKEQDF